MSTRVIKGWIHKDHDIDDSFAWDVIWYPDGHTGPKNSELCFDVDCVYQTQDDVPGLELSTSGKKVTITIEYDD